MEERYEFDEVTLLSAFAIGESGKRTFFLIVGQKEKWVRAWLEKEQLQTLALAIDEFLFTLSEGAPGLSRESEGMTLSDDFPSGLPYAEVEVDEIALGHEQERATLTFVVHVLGPQKLDRALLQCQTSLSQLKQFGNQSKKVCNAGRPRCVFCGGPIDPTGHICPKSN
jgi:uncharacterized repeat protein (TIGR03847 family)